MSECYILLVLGSRIEEVDFSHRLLLSIEIHILLLLINTRFSTSFGFRYISPFIDSLIPIIGSLHSGQI